jgi:hypothetical protein
MNKIKLVFIAGPYRANTRFGTERNIHIAETLAIEVAKLGAYPICPHANTRAYFEDLQDDEFWLNATRETLSRCDAVIFVSGWKQSTGALAEYELAKRIGLPTFLHIREVKEWLDGSRTEDNLEFPSKKAILKSAPIKVCGESIPCRDCPKFRECLRSRSHD